LLACSSAQGASLHPRTQNFLTYLGHSAEQAHVVAPPALGVLAALLPLAALALHIVHVHRVRLLQARRPARSAPRLS
jgi:hypothetical protein